MDVFPCKRVTGTSVLANNDMEVTSCAIVNGAESVTITPNGCYAFVAVINDYVLVRFIENKTASSVNYTSPGQNHVGILYKRNNSSLDIDTVGLNCITDDGYNVVVDDATPTDVQAALIVLNKTWCDLTALQQMYDVSP